MQVEIGTIHAMEGYRDPAGPDPEALKFRSLDGEMTIDCQVVDDEPLSHALLRVNAALRSLMVPDTKPAWVACPRDGLREELLRQWNLPPEAGQRPAGWGDDDFPVAPDRPKKPRKTPAKKAASKEKDSSSKDSDSSSASVTKAVSSTAVSSTATMLALMFTFGFWLMFFAVSRLALRTNAGRDWQARVMGDPAASGSGATASACWIGVTADTANPDLLHTSLLGEIISGTLVRKQATFNHVVGTAAYTLVAVFVADQSIVISKIGVFNAATTGTLVFESRLNTVSTNVAGDTTAVTHTVTL